MIAQILCLYFSGLCYHVLNITDNRHHGNSWYLYIFNSNLDSVLLYVYSSHTRLYKIVIDATINTYIAGNTMEYGNTATETVLPLPIYGSTILQLIVVFQYYAGRNSAGTGAHVVHSNCACTRSVNIYKLTVDCYIECTHYSC